MKKILFIFSLLLTFSFTAVTTSYAASHEAKADSAETKKKDDTKDSEKKADDEEPECD